MEGNPAGMRADRALLESLTLALGDDDSAELCYLLAVKARLELGPEGDPIAVRADAIASRLGLTGDAYPSILRTREAIQRLEHGQFREAAALFDAMVFAPGSVAAGIRTNVRSVCLAWAGDVDAQMASRAEHVADGRKYGRRPQEAHGVSDLARVAWRRGDRVECERLMSEIAVEAFVQSRAMAAALALHEGNLETALSLAPTEHDPQMLPVLVGPAAALRSAILLAKGDRNAASRQFERVRMAWGDGEALERLLVLGAAGETIVALADEAFAREIADFLARFPLLRGFGPQGRANPDALRGWLALRFEQLDDAEQHFNTGLEWASRPDVRFVLDQGTCHQGLAEVAARRGDPALAAHHLDAAGELFAKYGAKLYLDQVLAKKQILKA